MERHSHHGYPVGIRIQPTRSDGEVRIVQNLVAYVYGYARDVRLVKQSHPGRQRASKEDISERPPQLDIPVFVVELANRRRYIQEIRPVDRGGEVLEKLPFECHKDKIAAVRRLIVLPIACSLFEDI